MIDGRGRGAMQGALKAQELQCDVPQEALQAMAQKELTVLLEKQYGNVEPFADFIAGFCQGYREQRVVSETHEL